MTKNDNFKKYYEIIRKIDDGNFGPVYEVKKKESNEKRAIKVVDKNIIRNIYRNSKFEEPNDRIMKFYIDCYIKQIRNMKISEGKNKDNENTVKYYEDFDTENEFAIVMELCDDNLFNYLGKSTFDENCQILKQLNNTFKIMAENTNDIAYGELKLQNILLKYINKEKTKYIVKLKLTCSNDKMLELRKSFSTLSKSYYINYLSAPEILKGENIFNEKCYLWSLGIIIYILFYKKYPYSGTTEIEILNKIQTTILEKSDTDLNDLINNLLVKDPIKRYNWNQYFNHPFFKKKQNLDYKQKYEIIKKIAQSGYADIYLAKDKYSNEYRAIKVFDKKRVKNDFKKKKIRDPNEKEMKSFIEPFYNEINHMKILCEEGNINTVKLYEYFETNDEIASIMESCDDNLLDVFVKSNKCFSSEEILDFLNQLNHSFKIMVQNKLIHRALNLQNILINYKNKEKSKYIIKLKLTDDCCLINELSNNKFIIKGIINFYSPEILNQKEYNEECDLWSLGVIIYILYFREYPFPGNNKKEIINQINHKKLKKIENSELNDLINKLLIPDINKRITWTQYFNHPFFRAGNSHNNFRDYYELGKKIAEIKFAVIYQAKHKKTKEYRAIKVFLKDKFRDKIKKEKLKMATEEDLAPYIEGFYNEISHLKMISEGGNIYTVKYYEFFENEEEFAIVMELCDDDLLNYYSDNNQLFDSNKILYILNQLNNSFKIMNEKGLIHRDLNLENILVKYENNDKNNYIVKLKLTDDSCLLNELSKNPIFKIKGNIKFVAPEILKKDKNIEKCDLWSLGVIIYSLTFKQYPYNGDNEKDMLNQIKNNKLKKINDEILNDLMNKLLIEDPQKRLSWNEYFNHPFFKKDTINYKDSYILEKIADAKYAIIYKAKDKIKNVYRAIKVFDKNIIKSEYKKKHIKTPNEEEMKELTKIFYNEVKYMKYLCEGKNDNTVKLIDYSDTKDELAIIMELCDDNLFNLFIHKKEKKQLFNLNDIFNILKQLNNSFKIMAKKKLVHRALNLDNILIKYVNREKTNYIVKLKLTEDSGLIDELSPLTNISNHGNIYFLAPEILKGENDYEKCDLWSLGVIIYVLYFGEYPYRGENIEEILEKIKKNKLRKEINDNNLDDLLKKLLIENQKKRLNWDQYFNHSFFKE